MTSSRTRFWDIYSHSYDAIGFSIPYQNHMDDLLDALSLRDGEIVVDLGCATGNLERRLADRGATGISVVGIDYSESMIRRAGRKCRDCDSMAFVQADLTEGLPYESGSVDKVVSNNVIYAIADQGALVAEIVRVLRPGGVFVLSDPVPGTSIPAVIREHYRIVNSMPLASRIWNHIVTAIALPLTGVIPIALSRIFIDSKEREGGYHFSTEDEMRALLSGFSSTKIDRVYADQSWLIVATKEG